MPCRGARRTAVARCGRRWSARRRRCFGSARTPPRALVCSGQAGTFRPAFQHLVEHVREKAHQDVRLDSLRRLMPHRASATRLSGSGMRPRLPSIACRPSRDPRPPSPRHCSATGSTPRDSSPTPMPTLSSTTRRTHAPIRHDRPGPRRAAQRRVLAQQPADPALDHSQVAPLLFASSHNHLETLFDALLEPLTHRPFLRRAVGAAAEDERLRPGFNRHSPHLQAFADLVPGPFEQLLLEPLQLPLGGSHDVA